MAAADRERVVRVRGVLDAFLDRPATVAVQTVVASVGEREARRLPDDVITSPSLGNSPAMAYGDREDLCASKRLRPRRQRERIDCFSPGFLLALEAAPTVASRVALELGRPPDLARCGAPETPSGTPPIRTGARTGAMIGSPVEEASAVAHVTRVRARPRDTRRRGDVPGERPTVEAAGGAFPVTTPAPGSWVNR